MAPFNERIGSSMDSTIVNSTIVEEEGSEEYEYYPVCPICDVPIDCCQGHGSDVVLGDDGSAFHATCFNGEVTDFRVVSNPLANGWTKPGARCNECGELLEWDDDPTSPRA